MILFVYQVLVAIFMLILFNEKASWLTCSCILLALAGIILLYKGNGTFVPFDRKNKWYLSEGLNERVPFERDTMRYHPKLKSIKEINQKDKLYHPVKFLLEDRILH